MALENISQEVDKLDFNVEKDNIRLKKIKRETMTYVFFFLFNWNGDGFPQKRAEYPFQN